AIGGAIPAAVAERYFGASTSYGVIAALMVMLGLSFWKSATTCLKKGSRAPSPGCQTSIVTACLTAARPGKTPLQPARSTPAEAVAPSRMARRVSRRGTRATDRDIVPSLPGLVAAPGRTACRAGGDAQRATDARRAAAMASNGWS